jgi:CRISPR/Cas system CSM-associated protein Csm3 (group 7 of RAMP superfamily)
MKTERLDLHYQLHCRSVTHFGTGLRHGLVHRSMARDAEGFLYIPGSTLKGMLRDHATSLARLLGLRVRSPHNTGQEVGEFAPRGDITTLIFGSRFSPGTLFFDDANLCAEDREFFRPASDDEKFMTQQTETRTQVSLSRRTGTARRGLLFSSEYGVPDLRFNGRISGTLSGVPVIEGTTTYSLILLLASLSALEALGGNKSTGAGRLCCQITQLSIDGTALDNAEEVRQKVQAYLDLLPEFEYYELAEEEVC